jgi:endonuclease/exonuclease/phosphatase family metal-dependent hydrolase
MTPMPHARTLLAAALLWSCASATAHAQDTLRVIAWNVESGGARMETIAARLAELGPHHLWGLSEVQNPAHAAAYLAAVGPRHASVVGTTGGADRLVILYDSTRLDLLNSVELREMNPTGRARSPLVGHLRDRADGGEFLFMVNHLYRTNDGARHEQARQLGEWGAAQTLPVVSVGDFNFDWSVGDGDLHRDAGYDLMTSGDAFRWLRPATLVRTQCTFPSVLDFVFLSAAARWWEGESEIVARAEDCPDTEETSDHRPVRAWLVRSDVPPPAPTRDELLQRIEAVEALLDELRAAVRRLP